ncbi:Glycosyl hydrolases family 43 [Aquisphaera giovannonii]|uniref:Glycosyl hydrolases family 43 n=1 Tax=Aquisphaera giovannonii TaxID=406548 RepID=A0A5B9W3Z0_9BACT|nr:glycoside hydrolase family 43 protein [Aquisphaera giovannonii]QEH34831.1 Glycosyl hydrolases family 43 [Aquisphaera giovannonii]
MNSRCGILALVLVAAAGIPAAARDPLPADGPQGEPEDGLLFTYFVGNGEDGLHLATSEDGYTWRPLGGGRSYLKPQVGKSKLMRDPCLLRGPDGTFQMVWTDSWDSRTIGHASSKDLVHWSEQQAIGVMEHEPQALNCWAPEVTFDERAQRYLIFWSTTIPGRFTETERTGDESYNHRIYGTTTRDFRAFSPTRLLFDGGFNVIDATLLRAEGKFYLIVKDETLKPVKKHLRLAVADTPDGPYTDVSAPFTPSWVEGPSAIRVGEDYLVYFDRYRDHRYGAVRSRDLKHWEDITPRVSFPEGTKHGTVLRVPRRILEGL